MSDAPTQTAMVTAQASLWIASITIWVAALTPQFFRVWMGASDSLDVVAQHAALWRVNALFFLVGAVATLVGCVLVFASEHGPLASSALVLLTIATALWAMSLAVRMSVVPDVALHRSPQADSLLAMLQSVAAAAWGVAAVLLILAWVGIGAEVLTSAMLPAWVGWVCLGWSALAAVWYIATRDMPPIIVYLPVLPLAVAVTVDAVKGTR
ncbi:MAG: hypothetical protein WA971_05115 [Microbacterium sp.]